MLILGIALLLGIQVYIVQTFTMGSFRHVEKVNAHVRAIYVGESAFSRIAARLKAGRWEDRWFSGAPASENNVGLAGGTYSSIVAEVAPPTAKEVDVWIEAHYDQSVSLMYYRVAFVDDTLDFTAQVIPRFFTFLHPEDPNPFTGTLPPAVQWVKNKIQEQKDNEDGAIRAIDSLKGTCTLTQAGTTLGLTFPAPPLDGAALLDGTAQDACTYQNGVNAGLAGLPPPPPPVGLPPPPTSSCAGGPYAFHITDLINTTFLAGGITGLAMSPPIKITGPAANLFSNVKGAENNWIKAVLAHSDTKKPHGHNLKDHVKGFLDDMLTKADADLVAKAQIEPIVNAAINALIAQKGCFGGPAGVPLPIGTTHVDYMTNYNQTVQWLYGNTGGAYKH